MDRAYYLKHRDRILARAKTRSPLNKERKRAYDIEYNKRKRLERNVQSREWNLKNREKNKDIKARYRERNREKLRTYNKIYDLTHKGRVAARSARRRARELNATPPWLTLDHIAAIEQIYKNRPCGFHVDHIIPLQGKNVCGLHVPWNLQYLEAKENQRKGNRICGR